MGSFTKYTALAESLDLQSITENIVAESLNNHNDEILIDNENLRVANATNADVFDKLNQDVLSISLSKISAKNTMKDLKKYIDLMVQLYESNEINKKVAEETHADTQSYYRNKIKKVTEDLQRTPLAQHSLLLHNEIKLTEFRIKEHQQETDRLEKAYRRREAFRLMRERAIIIQIANHVIGQKRKAAQLKEMEAETARLKREITVERLQNVKRGPGEPGMAPLEVIVELDESKLPSPPMLTPFFDVLRVLNEDISQSGVMNTSLNNDEGMEPPTKLPKRAAPYRHHSDISLRKKCLTSLVPNLTSERKNKKASISDEVEVETSSDVAHSSGSIIPSAKKIEVLNEINVCENTAMKWVADVELDKLQKVDHVDVQKSENRSHVNTNVIIQEEEMVSSQAMSVSLLVPPTQFQDPSIATQMEQEEMDAEADDPAPDKSLTSDTQISRLRLSSSASPNVCATQHQTELIKLRTTPEFTYDKIDTSGSIVSKFFSKENCGHMEVDSEADQKKEQPPQSATTTTNIQSATPTVKENIKENRMGQDVMRGNASNTDARLEQDDTDGSYFDFSGMLDTPSLLLSLRDGEEPMEIVNEPALFRAEKSVFNLEQTTETAERETEGSENAFHFNFQQEKKKCGFFSLFG